LRHGERWLQRIQATLFHHGVAGTPDKLRTRTGAPSSTASNSR
jgi:hypothetical protein